MRKQLFTSAIAILALGFVLFPATADARAGGPVRQVNMQDNCDFVRGDRLNAPSAG